MATDRRADVVWNGSLQEGSGTIRSTTSGAIGEQKVSWPNRAEDSPDATSPEELIAAAHATCFSMALANALTRDGHEPTKLETDARVTLDNPDGAGYTITKIALSVRGDVDGLDESAFQEAAEQAKENCPVSKALAAVPEITLDASLA